MKMFVVLLNGGGLGGVFSTEPKAKTCVEQINRDMGPSTAFYEEVEVNTNVTQDESGTEEPERTKGPA